MSLRARIAMTKLFWWKSVDSTKSRLWIWWMSDTESLGSNNNQEKKKTFWNGSFYRPIESSRFHFLTLTHFCIPRKKNTHERDLNIQGWTVYLFAWCFSVISFSFDSLACSVSISVARENESASTLLQCMFVQCLCIPTIWHHYVRSSISFILFITFCCVARHRTTLFTLLFYLVLLVLLFFFCSPFPALVFTCAPFTNGDRVLVIVDLCGFMCPFHIARYPHWE